MPKSKCAKGIAAIVAIAGFGFVGCAGDGDESAPDFGIFEPLVTTWENALDSGDSAGVAGLYTDDGIMTYPDDRRPSIGRVAVRGDLESLLDAQAAHGCTFTDPTVRVDGDWAELAADVAASWTGRISFEERSRMFWVLRRQPDDTWRIARATFYPRETGAITDSDRAAFGAILRAWESELDAAHADGIAALYTGDAIVTYPDSRPPSVGGDAVRADLARLFSFQHASGSQVSDAQFAVHGDWGEIRAEFRTIWSVGGRTAAEHSRYIFIMRRLDGAWRIARFTFYPLP